MPHSGEFQPATAAAAEQPQSAATPAGRGNQRGRGGGAARGGRYYPRGGGAKPARDEGAPAEEAQPREREEKRGIYSMLYIQTRD